MIETYGCSNKLPFDDEQQSLWMKQRATRGFDDTELWNLDRTIALFILPRLKEYKNKEIGYSSSYENKESWYTDVEKMIDAFELIVSDEFFCNLTYEQEKIIDDGLDLFRKFYFSLNY